MAPRVAVARAAVTGRHDQSPIAYWDFRRELFRLVQVLWSRDAQIPGPWRRSDARDARPR
jgi:hypothetical protein